MTPEFWFKQTSEQPLFPDILWSRPEHRAGAGKLLVVGGNEAGFAAAQQAYQTAEKAGIGVSRVLLPDVLRKIVGPVLENGEYAPSTPSGSFSRKALSEFLVHSQWSDAVLLAGDLGRNSETTILLEEFVQKYSGLLTVTKDAIDYFMAQPKLLAEREQTTMVLSLSQLQKFGTALKFETPFLLSMGMLLLVQALHDFTLRYPVCIATKELDQIVVGHKGRVSSTKLPQDKEIWRVETAAKASVFWLQNPAKPFEAISTSIL